MAISEYKTRNGRRYLAALWLENQKVSSRGGFLTKREARLWLAEEEKRFSASRGRTHTGFHAFAEKYLDEIRDRKQQNTYSSKKTVIRRFLAHLGRDDFPLADISDEIVSCYLKQQKNDRGEKSANRDLRELRTLFNWGVRKGHAPKNPFLAFENYAEEAFVRYVPPPEDIDKVRLAATPAERDLIEAIFFTAGRLSEVLNLSWDRDINFEHRTVQLWTRKRRGGSLEPSLLAMHEDLYKLLYRRWKARDKTNAWVFPNPETSKPYHKNSRFVKNLFDRVCARAQVKRFTAHCIRHHVATRFIDSGKATSRQVQNFLRHKRLSTTETYLHSLQVDRAVLDAFDTKQKQSDNSANNSRP